MQEGEGLSVVSGDGPRFRPAADGGRAVLVALEQWMSQVTAEFESLTAEVDQLRRKSSELDHHLSALTRAFNEERRWVRSLPREAADFRQRVAELDERLNNVLAMFDTHVGGDGPGEQGMLHYDYSTEFMALVEQQILGLALDALADRQAAPRDKAEFVAIVCSELFGHPDVEEQRLIERLKQDYPLLKARRAQDICAVARELREKAAKGRPQRWDFNYVRGAPIDQERQEMWPGSAAKGVVDFIVSPAYVVDSDTLLKKQRVFTAIPDSECP